MATAINDLRLPADYQAERTHVFPSVNSLDWFVRRNRAELMQRGAIVAPLGRRLIVPEKFDRFVMQTVSLRGPKPR